MMRTLVVAASAVTLALTGCTATPEPVVVETESPTEVFYGELADYPQLLDPGVRDSALDLAQTTCSALGNGVPWDNIAASAADDKYAEENLAVSRAAVVAFCPEHLDQMEDR